MNLIWSIGHTTHVILVFLCLPLLKRIKLPSKKIVGHSGAQTLTERVYTHLDIQELLDAINLI